MIDDKDIYQAAKLLIIRHGDDAVKSHIGITLWYGFVVSLSCGEGLFYGFLGMIICILSGLAVGGHFGQCGTGNKERPVVVYGDLDSIGKHGLYLSSYVKTDNAESGGYLYRRA